MRTKKSQRAFCKCGEPAEIIQEVEGKLIGYCGKHYKAPSSVGNILPQSREELIHSEVTYIRNKVDRLYLLAIIFAGIIGVLTALLIAGYVTIFIPL